MSASFAALAVETRCSTDVGDVIGAAGRRMERMAEGGAFLATINPNSAEVPRCVARLRCDDDTILAPAPSSIALDVLATFAPQFVKTLNIY